MNQEMTNMIHRQQSSIVQRFFSLLLLLASTLSALAQATQPCIVKQYNQKQTKTPLAGVQVEVRDAGSAISDKAGQLTLKFATLKPGDKVTLRRITKNGYEIFNKADVAHWNISRNSTPFVIVLVKSDYFEQLKNSLKQTSVSSYKAKYEKAKADLARRQKEGRLKEQEYSQKLIDLENQYDNQLKNIDTYIDVFARFDLSELSEEEERIIEMVHNGQIDEAVKAYDDLKIMTDSYNQLAYLYADQNNLAKALETIDKAIELMPEDANLYDSKGEILLMKGDEQEALKMWRKVIELDPNFLKKHNGTTPLYEQLKEKGLVN